MALPHAIRIMLHPVRIVTHFLHRHYHHRYAGKYEHAEYVFAFDLLLVGIVIALAGTFGYLLFLRSALADKISISEEVRPHEIISGDRTTFTITYENRSKKIVDEAVIDVHLPPHFEFLQSYPTAFNLQNHTLPLGAMKPGEGGQIKISGILWADVGSPITLFTSLTFRSYGGWHDVKTARAEFPVTRSVLTGTVTVPPYLIGDEPFPFHISVHNTIQKIMPPVFLKTNFPQGAELVTSDQKYDGRWLLPALDAEGKTDVSGTARIYKLLNPSDASATLTFDLGVTLDGDDLLQGLITIARSFIPSPMALDVVISENNGATPIAPGALITGHITYTNTGSLPLKNIKITLQSASPFFPKENTSKPTTIESLAPGVAEIIPLTFKIKNSLSPTIAGGENAKNFSLDITPVAEGMVMKEGVPIPFISRGDTASYKIETPFVATAVGRYWTPEGDQIGRGSIPPLVDDTTKYWIFWTLTPTTNDVEHLEFRATLPENVVWTGKNNVTIGSPIVYNAATRTVTWTTNSLPATGPSGEIVSARFEVALTPTRDDIGKTPTLITETSVTAHDVFTNTDLETSTNRVTTVLSADRRALGKGVVEE